MWPYTRCRMRVGVVWCIREKRWARSSLGMLGALDARLFDSFREGTSEPSRCGRVVNLAVDLAFPVAAGDRRCVAIPAGGVSSSQCYEECLLGHSGFGVGASEGRVPSHRFTNVEWHKRRERGHSFLGRSASAGFRRLQRHPQLRVGFAVRQRSLAD